MEIVALVVFTSRVVKIKETLTFCKRVQHTYFVLKIELLLNMLSKFEREEALKDLVFRWVACLTHKVLRSVYSLLINLIGLALHMVWYMQHLRWPVVEWVRTK